MSDIPPLFLENMQSLLGDAYPAFLASYNDPPITGLRANTLKITPQALAERLPFTLERLPWSPAGFRLSERQAVPGKHPYHAAGLYYLQEPSAMAVAEALAPQPGERVLDLCAAPGGKSTHLAALMENQGLLVANEIHPQRVWELAENLERWGASNVAIANESPARLAQSFDAFFDRVLVDAPCSGEGMFRKSQTARQEWTPELVQRCAIRQKAILEDALSMVRPGGWLVYATCTFNPDENERVIASLLEANPQFELVAIPPFPGSQPGKTEWLAADSPPAQVGGCLRLWPHHCMGEGHFLALLRRQPVQDPQANDTHPSSYLAKARHMKGPNTGASASAIQLFEQFCREHLTLNPAAEQTAQQRLQVSGTYLYALPQDLPNLGDLRLIHPGRWLGSLHTGKTRRQERFIPSHALAMSLRPENCQQVINLSADDPQIRTYLHGGTWQQQGKDGWALVCVDEFPLGWAKRVQGQIKNYYPRGLRWL
ncbi:MAG: RsmB/NOP family class I SAM-dependent RNA methyltransferase [Chloroflexota bacterium]